MTTNQDTGEARKNAVPRRLTKEEVVRIVGRVNDSRATAILRTGASAEELEEAVALATGESDVIGDLRVRPSATVGALIEILTAEQRYGDERE